MLRINMYVSKFTYKLLYFSSLRIREDFIRTVKPMISIAIAKILEIAANILLHIYDRYCYTGESTFMFSVIHS